MLGDPLVVHPILLHFKSTDQIFPILLIQWLVKKKRLPLLALEIGKCMALSYLTLRGSVIAKVVGRNVQKYPDIFEEQVRMWVFEEVVDGKPLTEWINSQHENVKYLPGVKLPETVYADPDILTAIDQATILVFVIPHQFVGQVCHQIKGKVHPRAKAVSLIKGVDVNAKGLSLISDVISEQLQVDTSVLMGANIANEVAQEYFSESTLGKHE